MIRTLTHATAGQGLYEITSEVIAILKEAAASEDPLDEGLCTIFVQHTSASLLIQENADPSARRDLEKWLKRLVPPNDALFTHTAEGPDDMPAHVKAALTNTSLGIPIVGGELVLGTWQGIYLWEHRDTPHKRRVVVSVFHHIR